MTDRGGSVQLPLDRTTGDEDVVLPSTSSGQYVRRSVSYAIKGGDYARHLETKGAGDLSGHCVRQLHMTSFECADVLRAHLNFASKIALRKAARYPQVSKVLITGVHDHHIGHTHLQHCETAGKCGDARICLSLLPLRVGRRSDVAPSSNLRATEPGPGSGVSQAARIETAEAALHRWYSTVSHNVTRLFLVAHNVVGKQIGYHRLFKPDYRSKV
ncbi:hypothetical protein R4P52_21500 [Rhodococcus sp. IEGM 1374]|nr:hypothetical protein [Rhodococcus sp. IEGM 1374]MDV7991558.1 hypothetical protein [Rhodococcus sp. IEGM 1374]